MSLNRQAKNIEEICHYESSFSKAISTGENWQCLVHPDGDCHVHKKRSLAVTGYFGVSRTKTRIYK